MKNIRLSILAIIFIFPSISPALPLGVGLFTTFENERRAEQAKIHDVEIEVAGEIFFTRTVEVTDDEIKEVNLNLRSIDDKKLKAYLEGLGKKTLNTTHKVINYKLQTIKRERRNSPNISELRAKIKEVKDSDLAVGWEIPEVPDVDYIEFPELRVTENYIVSDSLLEKLELISMDQSTQDQWAEIQQVVDEYDRLVIKDRKRRTALANALMEEKYYQSIEDGTIFDGLTDSETLEKMRALGYKESDVRLLENLQKDLKPFCPPVIGLVFSDCR